MDLEELEMRIMRIDDIEDIEAIKQLKARYCEICDEMHSPNAITSLFAKDGIWESPEFGKAQGHAAIRELFQRFQSMFGFSHHNITNSIIDIDGDCATGIWYLMDPRGCIKVGRKIWMTARYDDDYVKIGGVWKFQHLRTTVRMVEKRS